MRFPVIKIIDNQYKDMKPRIVGANSHDLLVIDEKSGGIQYHNLQNGEGTQRYEDDPDGPAYSFAADNDKEQGDELDDLYEYPYGMEIQFVTIEEMVEIYIKHTEASCERERKLRDMLKKAEERRTEAIKKNGLDVDDGTWNSGGALI